MHIHIRTHTHTHTYANSRLNMPYHSAMGKRTRKTACFA